MKALFHPGRRRSNSVQYDSGISGSQNGSGESSLASKESLELVAEEARDSLSSSAPRPPLSRGPPLGRRMRSVSLSIASSDWSDSAAAILIRTRNLPIDYRSSAVPLLKSLSLPSPDSDSASEGGGGGSGAGGGGGGSGRAEEERTVNRPPGAEELNLFMVEEAEQGLGRILQAFTCYEAVPTNAKVVALDTRLPVRKAFTAFINNCVRAALIWDSGGPGDAGRLVGVLSITDFIRVLLKFHDETYGCRELRIGVNVGGGEGVEEVQGLVTPPSSLPKDSILPMEAPDSVLQLDSVERRLEEQKIGAWRGILEEQGSLEPLLTITSHESLYRAAQLLAERHLHRLPILDPASRNPLHILTLKGVLRFAWRRGARLSRPPSLAKTPAELGLGVWGLSIRSVRPSTPLIDALRLLIEKRISGLPVVDPANRVVDVFTRFDAIGIAADSLFDKLSSVSVEEALHHRSQNKAIFEGVVRAGMDERLESVVERMVEAEVHRVLIVGEGDVLKGLVSISDVVQHLILGPINAASAASTANVAAAASFPSPPEQLPQPAEEMEWVAGVADEMEIIHEELG